VFKSFAAALAAAFFLTVVPAHAQQGGFEWDPIGLDMFNQPSMKSQGGWYGRALTYPANTVPTRGIEPAMTRDEADTELTNPIAMSAESVAKGRFAYSRNCAACHGLTGTGETPVAAKLAAGGAAVPDITFVMSYRSEGFIYGTIRNGGVLMPAYGAQTTPAERWHIVNFIRSLQAQ
jgi:S-disulfanyl-L-cysteine oxidoreductase SoxD